MKKVDFPVCDVSIPTVFEKECDVVVRTRFNARSLAPRVRNGVARALRTGYVTTYSGQVAAWYRAVCKAIDSFPTLITCTPAGRDSYQRGVFFAAYEADPKRIKEAQDRWTPYVLLMNPEAGKNTHGYPVVNHYMGRYSNCPPGMVEHNFRFDNLSPDMALRDIKELFPSILPLLAKQEDAVTRWVAGGDFDVALSYTGSRRISDARVTA